MNKEKLMRRASHFSIAVAAFLLLVKTFAAYKTGSSAILGSLLDSAVDITASFINFLAIRQAIKAADHGHPFGHGKAENLAVLAQGIILVGSGLWLASDSVKNILHPSGLQDLGIGIGSIIITLVATGFLVAYQRKVIKATHSVVVRADSMHYSGDLALHISILVSLGLYFWLGLTWIDGLFGCGIAGWLVYSGIKIGKESVVVLMDHSLPANELKMITEQINANPKVKGFHKLYTRISGSKRIIQFHLELEAELPLDESDEIAEEVEKSIRSIFPNSEILIHQEPHEDC